MTSLGSSLNLLGASAGNGRNAKPDDNRVSLLCIEHDVFLTESMKVRTHNLGGSSDNLAIVFDVPFDRDKIQEAEHHKGYSDFINSVVKREGFPYKVQQKNLWKRLLAGKTQYDISLGIKGDPRRSMIKFRALSSASAELVANQRPDRPISHTGAPLLGHKVCFDNAYCERICRTKDHYHFVRIFVLCDKESGSIENKKQLFFGVNMLSMNPEVKEKIKAELQQRVENFFDAHAFTNNPSQKCIEDFERIKDKI